MRTEADAAAAFYGSLASWWPLISPVEDYADEAGHVAELLQAAHRPVRTVLELGSGGGNNAWHLKAQFDLTLSDLSADMLAVSRRLNPELPHHQGDMRTMRLDATFDAVFVHDAIDYMTTEHDLAAACATIAAHLEPGGLAVIMGDATTETFEPGTEMGGIDADDGRGVRYLEWTWDPDPDDHHIQTEYTFVLRNADGAINTVHETHHYGLFPETTWLRLLTDAGLTPSRHTEHTDDDRQARTVFLATRPKGASSASTRFQRSVHQ